MKAIFAILYVLLCVACDGKSNPAAPPPPPNPGPPPVAPTPVSLSISSPASAGLRTGETQTFAAMVAMSDGTTRPATSVSWNSDNTSVLTINSSGAATGNVQGNATIVANADGLSASVLVRVFQNYQGTWTGQYRVRVCTDTGVFARFCREEMPVGTTGSIALTLTQNAGSVTGTLALDGSSAEIRGAVYETQRFVGSARIVNTSQGLTLTLNIGTFSALSSQNTLSGTFTGEVIVGGVTGNVYFEADLVNVRR